MKKGFMEGCSFLPQLDVGVMSVVIVFVCLISLE